MKAIKTLVLDFVRYLLASLAVMPFLFLAVGFLTLVSKALYYWVLLLWHSY